MTSNAIKIVVLSGIPPAFKNAKRAILDSNTGKMRTLTPSAIKKRMDSLENGILSALYSCVQTSGAGMDSAWLKQLRTRLSDLCDDSLAEIPEFSFGVRDVAKGQEGVEIYIEELK